MHFFFTCCSSSLIRHSGRRAAGDKPPLSTADSTPSTPVSPQASSEASTRGVMAAIIPDRSRPLHQQNGSASKICGLLVAHHTTIIVGDRSRPNKVGCSLLITPQRLGQISTLESITVQTISGVFVPSHHNDSVGRLYPYGLHSFTRK